MLSKLLNLFGARHGAPAAAIPPGQRVYAVGDVHGRADLFGELANAIEADHAARGPADSLVILLGDLVDRGPDSAAVMSKARAWQQLRPLRVLMGNHEEMFLNAFENIEILRQFLRHGGRETVLSYPVDPASYAAASLVETQQLMRDAVPEADLAFMRAMEGMVRVGDYLFVHAGIRPGVPLDQQRGADLRWIREPFVTSREDLGCTVVYGHTIYDRPEFAASRIGIDTGAYASGRLTALGLEGTSRWLLETCNVDGAISVSQRSIA